MKICITRFKDGHMALAIQLVENPPYLWFYEHTKDGYNHKKVRKWILSFIDLQYKDHEYRWHFQKSICPKYTVYELKLLA